MKKILLKAVFPATLLFLLFASCDSTKANKKNVEKAASDSTAIDTVSEDEEVQPNTGCD